MLVERLEIGEALAPDLVLVDVRMPGMSGIELAYHLAALDRPPAVVFATAYDEFAVEEALRRKEQAGAGEVTVLSVDKQLPSGTVITSEGRAGLMLHPPHRS